MIDNSVLPSFLDAVPRGWTSGSTPLTNYVLRMGEVKKVIPPTSKKSVSRQTTEYEVEVEHRDDYGSTSHTRYVGVVAVNGFGGGADHTEATFRAATKNPPDGEGNGSKVLLLCVSGDQTKAVILGGIPKKSTDSSHHYAFEFNGAKLTVNSEGEVEFVHRGPTEINGAVKENYEGFEGTSAKFNKRGNFELIAHDGSQRIALIHANPDNPDEDKSIDIHADKKLSARSDGTIKIDAADNIDVQSDAMVYVKSEGVWVGEATDWTIKGTTYRDNEATCNSNVAQNLSTAGTSLTSAIASLQAAAALNSVPVIGGLMALPAFLTMASTLATAAGALTAASIALQSFEGGAPEYLSKKNKSD